MPPFGYLRSARDELYPDRLRRIRRRRLQVLRLCQRLAQHLVEHGITGGAADLDPHDLAVRVEPQAHERAVLGAAQLVVAVELFLDLALQLARVERRVDAAALAGALFADRGDVAAAGTADQPEAVAAARAFGVEPEVLLRRRRLALLGL